MPIKNCGAGLRDLYEIRTDKMPRLLKQCRFSIACDVTNPLCGKLGCSAVFGPQKGATAMVIADMDKALKNFAKLTREVCPKADPDYPGAGAAGGLGFAFLSYLKSEMRSGAELVMEAIGLEEHIKASDIVITGEGRMDGQSAMGKAPVGVARLAKKHKKITIAITGSLGEGAELCHPEGITAIFPILRAPTSLTEAMKPENAKNKIESTTEQLIRLIRALRSVKRK